MCYQLWIINQISTETEFFLKINPRCESLKDRLQRGCGLPTIPLDEDTRIKYAEGALKRDKHKPEKIHKNDYLTCNLILNRNKFTTVTI